MAAQAAADESAEALLCPACGYDLRGTTGNRCSECGLTIDREALKRRAFPWAHRHELGRIRAYVHTVWLVTFGGRALHAQTDKPQETIGAMRFRGVTAAIVAISLLVPFGFFAFSDAWKVELYVPVWPDDGAGLGGWVFALAVPWWAGVLLWPVLPGCLILLAWHMSRLGSVVVRAPLGAPQEERDRAAAIGCYAIAPLAWLLPAAVIWLSLTSALAYLEDIWRRFGLVGDLGIALVACILYLLLALGVLATLWRLGQCARRVRVGRLWMTPAAAVECGLLAIVGAVVLLGLLPWAIGFLWLVFDSLR